MMTMTVKWKVAARKGVTRKTTICTPVKRVRTVTIPLLMRIAVQRQIKRNPTIKIRLETLAAE